jgi:hypothetical protein
MLECEKFMKKLEEGWPKKKVVHGPNHATSLKPFIPRRFCQKSPIEDLFKDP